LNKVKLSVSELKAYYFTTKGIIKAVDDINFEIYNGESLGIAGESACGKSSLGAALLRILQPPGKIAGGSIKLNDEDIIQLPDSYFDKKIRWKKISMVFQGAMNTLDPVYRIGDQMKEIMEQHQFKGNIDSIILESLKQVGLDKTILERYPHQLSGGMKQRVVIAMALLLDPEIVIADEPTTALDVLVQAQIMSLLKRLKNEKGMTIILITHDLAIISEIADKIAIMYAGQIVEFGASSEIYKNAKHPYTQALLSAIPKLHSSDKQMHFVKGNPPNLLNLTSGCRFYSRCPHVMEICKEDPPEIKTENNGYVRCWLYK
jgi:peptide/nickel transport system ATP-binding protein